jgi:acyl-CoA synthetase (NDP forming)
MDYPVALKVVSPQVLHKSDVGGVKLNLKNETELRRAYEHILSEVKMKVPAAHILGTAVQPMAFPGLEVIIGAVRDPQFGPAVMFGLGGLMVEALKDISFRLAPLSRQEAGGMIREIKSFPVLNGLRGQPKADLAAIEKILLSVSDLIVQETRIQEIDLNPVMIYPHGYLIADARITLV